VVEGYCSLMDESHLKPAGEGGWRQTSWVHTTVGTMWQKQRQRCCSSPRPVVTVLHHGTIQPSLTKLVPQSSEASK
jgi:hypothetical protein